MLLESQRVFVLFCDKTNYLMLGNSEQCVMFVPRSLRKTLLSVFEVSLSFSSLCRNNN